MSSWPLSEAEAEAMINQTFTDAQFVQITRGLFGWHGEPSKTQRKN